MVLAVGPITQVGVQGNAAQLQSAAASGGTGPYTYQWYRSQQNGFSPGVGSILAGKTALTLSDSGLIPNTVYYYVIRVTDTGDSNVTEDSAQFTLTTDAMTQSQNQFAQTPVKGMVDLPYNTNTKVAQIHSTESGTLYPGDFVKIVDEAGGVPKVVKCSAVDDECWGVINYNIKSPSFIANSVCEISQKGNVVWLYATAAIARGAQVAMGALFNGVAPLSTGQNIIGIAYDKASAAGELIRVELLTPSFLESA